MVQLVIESILKFNIHKLEVLTGLLEEGQN